MELELLELALEMRLGLDSCQAWKLCLDRLHQLMLDQDVIQLMVNRLSSWSLPLDLTAYWQDYLLLELVSLLLQLSWRLEEL